MRAARPAERDTTRGRTLIYCMCKGLSAHGRLADENLQITTSQPASSAVSSGLPSSSKLSIVEGSVGSLAGAECAGGVGGLGVRSEGEKHLKGIEVLIGRAVRRHCSQKVTDQRLLPPSATPSGMELFVRSTTCGRG